MLTIYSMMLHVGDVASSVMSTYQLITFKTVKCDNNHNNTEFGQCIYGDGIAYMGNNIYLLPTL